MVVNAKEIRNDLEGFLKNLKNGKTIQVLYRSKPMVTIGVKNEIDEYLAEKAGSAAAAKQSVRFVNSLPKRQPTFDPNKSFKELYEQTQRL